MGHPAKDGDSEMGREQRRCLRTRTKISSGDFESQYYANLIKVSCVRAKAALSLNALSCNRHNTVQSAVKKFNLKAASPNVVPRVQLGNPGRPT